MSTRDLGMHVVELHAQGMLDISGEGTRLTLSAQEALDLLRWLGEQRKTLEQMAKAPVEEVPAWLHNDELSPEEADDPDVPVDEP